jgi:hypothetical protein
MDSDCVAHRRKAVFELHEISIAMAATRPLQPSQHSVNVFEIARMQGLAHSTPPSLNLETKS